MENQDLEIRNREYREEIERILAENKYLENYLFAEYVIKTFINDDRNYQRGRFFRAMKIDRKLFNYCAEIINFLNPSLYQEYLDAVALISEKKTQHMIRNINLIAEAIKTGYLNDGSKFDILDFYRFIPFIESGLGFVTDLKRFMRECDEIDDGVYEIITNYMRDNKITGIIFANEKYALKKQCFFEGLQKSYSRSSS